MISDSENLDLKKIKIFQQDFAEERDWDQFHNPKNLAMALSVECSELLEIFQWASPEESSSIMNDPVKKEAVEDELADILFYLIRISDKLGVDLERSLWKKIRKNAEKYPVHLSKGNAKKYSEFRDTPAGQ